MAAWLTIATRALHSIMEKVSVIKYFVLAIFFLSLPTFVLAQRTDGPAYTLERANYWGSEIAVLRNWSDMQECARLCDEDSSCVVASYHDQTAGDYANTCVHRYKVGSRHPEQSNVFSWVRPPATAATIPVDAANTSGAQQTDDLNATEKLNYVGRGVYGISGNRIYRFEEGKLFDDSGNVYTPDVTSEQISRNGELVMVYHETKKRWVWIEGAPSKTCALRFYCVDEESIIRSYKYRQSVLTTSEQADYPILTIENSKYINELGEPVFSLFGGFCTWCSVIVLHNYYEQVYKSDAIEEINAFRAVAADDFDNSNSIVVEMLNWGDNFDANHRKSRMLYFTSIEGESVTLNREQIERIKNRWLILNKKRWHSYYSFDVPEAGYSVSKRQARKKGVEAGDSKRFVLEIKIQPEIMAEFQDALTQ